MAPLKEAKAHLQENNVGTLRRCRTHYFLSVILQGNNCNYATAIAPMSDCF